MNIQYVLYRAQEDKTVVTIAHTDGESCITVDGELKLSEVADRLQPMFQGKDVGVFRVDDNHFVGAKEFER